MVTTARDMLTQIAVSDLERDIVEAFRREWQRLSPKPSGFVFTVDANPDRLVATLAQRDCHTVVKRNGRE